MAHIFGKDTGVTVALEAEWRLQCAFAERGDNAGASGAIAWFFSVEPWPSFAPSACQAMAVVDAAFIHIDQPVFGNAANRFLPQAAGKLIALGVQQCFFYGQYAAVVSL